MKDTPENRNILKLFASVQGERELHNSEREHEIARNEAIETYKAKCGPQNSPRSHEVKQVG